jgi:hypothetical protein
MAQRGTGKEVLYKAGFEDIVYSKNLREMSDTTSKREEPRYSSLPQQGPYYPLGSIRTVPMAYDIFRLTKEREGEKIKNNEMKKIKILSQNKIQDFKNTFFISQNSTISLPVKWGVCGKSTFLSLCA